jgi:hypothetical protein
VDDRAGYDYQGGGVERPELAGALSSLVDGDVRFDSYSRALYSTDASLYEVTPIGVVCPRSTGDVAAVLDYCSTHGIAVLPRGGGTSLAGQTLNEAVVLEFSRHMTDVVSVDPGGRTAVVQPGVTLGSLNETLAVHDLKFVPDPAWGDKSVVGGAIGNNSTGAHSYSTARLTPTSRRSKRSSPTAPSPASVRWRCRTCRNWPGTTTSNPGSTPRSRGSSTRRATASRKRTRT